MKKKRRRLDWLDIKWITPKIMVWTCDVDVIINTDNSIQQEATEKKVLELER